MVFSSYCYLYLAIQQHTALIALIRSVLLFTFNTSCYFLWLKYNPLLYSMSAHGVIILNRSNNFVFLYLKIYWNRQVFDFNCASGISMKPESSSPGFFLKILNSVFESINMGLDHKLFLQLFVIGFCLFYSRIGKR